jgi:hypothetical protein
MFYSFARVIATVSMRVGEITQATAVSEIEDRNGPPNCRQRAGGMRTRSSVGGEQVDERHQQDVQLLPVLTGLFSLVVTLKRVVY